MKAAFLIIDYVPHQVLTIKKLAENHNCTIQAYHAALFTDYVPEIINFETQLYTELSKQTILKQIIEFNPDIIVVAGWMIKEYVWIAKQLKQKVQVPIVSYSDTQWYGTLKQRINAFISPFHVQKAFTHIWVAGIYQYEYARKLGFEKKQILLNSLSADTDLFQQNDTSQKHINYPKTFLYIGRFSEEKGLDVLVNAWNAIVDKKGWALKLIGDGHLKDSFSKNESIIINDYMPQEKLVAELKNAGCFILPSIKEPWALVIHEAAVAGLPIICTNICGAAPHFVINNYNGYTTDPNNVGQMKTAMLKIMNMEVSQLLEFSKRSSELGLHITPETSIMNLLQVL